MLLGSILSFFKKAFLPRPVFSDGSIYELEMTLLNGKKVQLSSFRGKKLLIVNTASQCGYTYQFGELQKLQDKFADKLQVLGFPSNDFFQDRDSNKGIAEFCQINYGVSFPMFEKIHVTGSDPHRLFQILAAKSGKQPVWNFCKYLLDENGESIGFFNSRVKPLDARITSRIA